MFYFRSPLSQFRKIFSFNQLLTLINQINSFKRKLMRNNQPDRIKISNQICARKLYARYIVPHLISSTFSHTKRTITRQTVTKCLKIE